MTGKISKNLFFTNAIFLESVGCSRKSRGGSDSYGACVRFLVLPNIVRLWHSVCESKNQLERKLGEKINGGTQIHCNYFLGIPEPTALLKRICTEYISACLVPIQVSALAE